MKLISNNYERVLEDLQLVSSLKKLLFQLQASHTGQPNLVPGS
jgi:hypothetical protein